MARTRIISSQFVPAMAEWRVNMRVDLLQVPGQSGLKVKAGTGAYTDSLKEGDRVKVDVLSSEKGSVILKSEGGQVFKARLDTNAELSQGDKVLLEYSGREGKLVFLSIMRGDHAPGDIIDQSPYIRDFDDKSLAPFADKLAELHIPVNEETARAMRELITQNPGMTFEEAAFIASNKLADNENLINAALNILSGGDKTDAMLARLITMLTSPDLPAQPDQFPSPDAPLSTRETDSPLTELLKLVEESATDKFAAETAENTVKETQSDTRNNPEVIITQSDTDLQSRNVIKNVENQQNIVYSVEKSVSEIQNSTITQAAAAGRPPESRLVDETTVPALAIHNESGEQAAAIQEPVSRTEIIDPQFDAAASSVINPQPSTINSQFPTIDSQFPTRETNRMIAQILADIPEFRGTPAPALERFSDMLLRIVQDSADTASGDIKKLAGLLERLFTRIERNSEDEGAGERLRRAREELFVRLSLVEEAISRAAPQAKTEILGQTRRLMDHVRLLNSIDQFVYMQLPVKLDEERRTAELYIFKKKNGKRIDPDNANILLALDLENMGHWEGLINIRDKDVSIRMEVRGADEKEYFSENTVMLHELLAEAGFKLVSAAVNCSEKETTPLTALSVLDRYTKARSGGIDLTI